MAAALGNLIELLLRHLLNGHVQVLRLALDVAHDGIGLTQVVGHEDVLQGHMGAQRLDNRTLAFDEISHGFAFVGWGRRSAAAPYANDRTTAKGPLAFNRKSVPRPPPHPAACPSNRAKASRAERSSTSSGRAVPLGRRPAASRAPRRDGARGRLASRGIFRGRDVARSWRRRSRPEPSAAPSAAAL